MALTPCSDLSAASWITASDQPWDQPWDQLIGFGPPGFPAYARLRFIPDPAHEGQSENDAEFDEHAPSESVRLRAALRVLAGHTGTPDDCYFCLWEGWGWTVQGGDGAWTLALQQDTTPAPTVRHAPKLVLPHRAYFLFHGSASELGDWGAAQARPDQHLSMPDAAFIWPADHAWCIANDVDPHWAGIGADTAAIDQLLADPFLDVVRADPSESQPCYR